MYKNSKDFSDFIASNCNRQAFIQDYLFRRDLETAIIPMEGKNHIYVKFPSRQYNPMFKIKTVIAHYDRVEGSPGANDNSAAVFSLMNWAEKLLRLNTFHNIRLLFTDGEELGEGGVESQGAFALARLFKKLSIINDDVFVFDATGRGTIPVICEANLSSEISKNFTKKYGELEKKAERILRNSTNGKWFKLPASYSDNAGFLANGIPAIAITMLPSTEIDLYLQALFNLKSRNFDTIKKSADLQDAIPKTWKMFHTMEDSIENLDERSYEVMEEILDNIVKLKSIAER